MLTLSFMGQIFEESYHGPGFLFFPVPSIVLSETSLDPSQSLPSN